VLRFFWLLLRVFFSGKPAGNHFSVLCKADRAECSALQAAMHDSLRFFLLPLRVFSLRKTRRKTFFRTTEGRCAALGPSQPCDAMHGAPRFFLVPLRVFLLEKPAGKHFSVLRKAGAQRSALHSHAMPCMVRCGFFWCPCGFFYWKNPQENIFPYYGRQVRSARPFTAMRCHAWFAAVFFGAPAGFFIGKPAGKHFSVLRKAGAQRSALHSHAMPCMVRCGFFWCPCGFFFSEKPAGNHFFVLRKAGAQRSALHSHAMRLVWWCVFFLTEKPAQKTKKTSEYPRRQFEQCLVLQKRNGNSNPQPWVDWLIPSCVCYYTQRVFLKPFFKIRLGL
jgi:hypothetical protein